MYASSRTLHPTAQAALALTYVAAILIGTPKKGGRVTNF